MLDWTCRSGTRSLEGMQGLAQGIGRGHGEIVVQKNSCGGFEVCWEEDWLLLGENLTIITKVTMADFY